MNSPLLLTLVSGCFAAIAAIVALVQASRVAAIKEKAEVQLAQLRNTTEQRQTALEIARQESVPIENALAQAWTTIQLARDIIATLLDDPQLHLSIALQTLGSASTDLDQGYAEWGAKLPESAKVSWHRAKWHVTQLKAMLASESNAFKSSDLEQCRLQSLRQDLAEAQSVLASERANILQSQFRRILEIL